MKCHYCGVEVPTNVVHSESFQFCDNLCRRSFQKGYKATGSKLPVETPPTSSTIPNPKIALQNVGGYIVHPRETLYFSLRLFGTLCVVSNALFWITLYPTQGLGVITAFVFYGILIAFSITLQTAILVGHVRGNGVEISKDQFPDIYHILTEQSMSLGLNAVPKLYTIQAGGALNALAVRYVGRNYIVLFSDMLETAYENGPEAVAFILGHELGHLKRKHHLKNLLLLPSILVPFLTMAYFRACEYSCDNIGNFLCPEGAETGISILATGKHLHARLDKRVFAEQLQRSHGFSVWLAEVFSTHPHTAKRMANVLSQSSTSL